MSMTENEAIRELERHIQYLRESWKPHPDYDVIEALKEAIYALDKLEQYRAIGTVEEFKALKEKSEPKNPIYSDFDDNGNDEIIPYKAICPVCGHEFNFGSWNEEENHHCRCGQALDWQ